MGTRKSVFTALMIFTSGLMSYAQFTNCKVDDIEKLKKSTVVVAISDDEATNNAAKEAMTSYWTVSKFTLIKKSELQAYLKANPENYVLTYIMDNTVHTFERIRTTTTGNTTTNTHTSTGTSRAIGDGLILAKNVKKVKRLDPTDAMAYCFIDVDMAEISEQAEFIRQLGSINSVLTLPNLQDNQIGKWRIPTINQKEVTSKELWIADQDLNKKGEDEAKMKAAYKPFKYKIVTKEEIANAIIDKKKDIVYLACVEYQTGLFLFMIQKPEDNRVLFMLGGTRGFDAKSFEKIKIGKVYGN